MEARLRQLEGRSLAGDSGKARGKADTPKYDKSKQVRSRRLFGCKGELSAQLPYALRCHRRCSNQHASLSSLVMLACRALPACS